MNLRFFSESAIPPKKQTNKQNKKKTMVLTKVAHSNLQVNNEIYTVHPRILVTLNEISFGT